MNTAQEINTSAALPLPPITDLAGLTDAIARMATLQLLINTAAADTEALMAPIQAEIESLKTSFAQATYKLEEEKSSLLAQVEKYCGENKASVFPYKGKTQLKTRLILEHELSFSASSSVAVPAGPEGLISALISDVEASKEETQFGLPKERVLSLLKSLVPTAAPQFSKTAFNALLKDSGATGLHAKLAACGFKKESKDSFSVSLHLPASSKESTPATA